MKPTGTKHLSHAAHSLRAICCLWGRVCHGPVIVIRVCVLGLLGWCASFGCWASACSWASASTCACVAIGRYMPWSVTEWKTNKKPLNSSSSRLRLLPRMFLLFLWFLILSFRSFPISCCVPSQFQGSWHCSPCTTYVGVVVQTI